MKPYIHKINYYETDKMGITHHSNYVRFMEEARVYFLDQIGWSFIDLENKGLASPVISIECNFKKTTTFPDEIAIEIYVDKISACKLTFGYIYTVKDEVVFTAKSSHCFLDKNGAPVIVQKVFPEFFEELKKYVKD